MNLNPLIKEYGGCESNADELYSALFHLGDGFIEQTAGKNAPTTYKGNPIIYANDEPDYKGQWRRYILLEDEFLNILHEVQKEPSNLLNSCTYYGKRKDTQRMDKCFGLIFDLDDVDETKVNNLLYQCRGGVSPMPNFIVVSKSGKGLHLYYIFDRPLRMYPNYKIELKELKYKLTERIWNIYTSNNKNVQQQSYDQSFMVAGSTPTMKVYKLNDRPWSIDELSEVAYYDFKWDKYKPTTYTKEEAKEMFPEWYEKVVIRGEKADGRWTCKKDLYNWWIRQIKAGAVYGTRFWCVMFLVVYAIKCEVSREQVEKDIRELKPLLDLKAEPQFPFTEHDIESALEAYDESFVTFPIKDIERHSKIQIKRNKRNKRSQAKHLEGARAIRDINNENWRKGNGRKPQHKEAVEQYFREHPNASVTDCASDLNIARTTVYRWKK